MFSGLTFFLLIGIIVFNNILGVKIRFKRRLQMMYWYFSQINHEPKQRLLHHGAVVFYVHLFFVTYLYILSCWLYKLSIFVGMEDELCSLYIFKDLGCQYFFINKFMLLFTEFNFGKFKKNNGLNMIKLK